MRLFISIIFASLTAICSWSPAIAQSAELQAEPTSYLMNARDVDIHVFADEVSGVTGRTLILDPVVNGKVTILSQEPLDRDGVWQLFQAVLRVHGYAVIQSGPAWRVVPQTDLRESGPFTGQNRPGFDAFVTRLIRLENLRAEDAVRALKPFLPGFGSIEAFARPNALVVTGYGDDVRRIEDLAAQLDQYQGNAVASIRLDHAAASDLAPLLERVVGSDQPGSLRVFSDTRSNQLLLRGTEQEISEARRLAESLDVPTGASVQTRVFRLAYSDAESMIEILQGLAGVPVVTNPVARQIGVSDPQSSFSAPQRTTLATNPASGGVQSRQSARALSGGNTSNAGTLALQVAPAINAIVARGTPGEIAGIADLIEQLDVRRAQVMIEAAIVEINGDIAEQFGVQLGLGDAAPDGSVGAVSFSDQGLSLRRILAILGAPAAVGLTEDGLSLGIGSRDGFGLLVQAFGSSSKANLLSTPSLTTLDNQSAEIIVGQNVPFRTGTFSPSGSGNDPFTTIQREDVGITLRVLPRIYSGDVVQLEVSQEVSSLVNVAVPGASDLITNRRSIQTTVLADNGSTIVLGGLTTDDLISGESKVPILGDIPIVGNLFKSQSEASTRRTLFVFLRPVILRSREEVEANARDRYLSLRSAERDLNGPQSVLIDGRQSKLPERIEGLY